MSGFVPEHARQFMAAVKQVEITCSACNRDSILVRSAKYEGFKRVGDALTCSSCGYEYENEESVPFKPKKAIRLFTDDDTSRAIHVFSDDEKGRICRYCEHYVVNPFTQKCGLHIRTVEATDTCDDFSVHEKAQEEPS
ncbi:MAG: hypothetical protein E4H02_00735 [Lentisphaerales bacterium]|jgi:hypothetical protein|nr:MAG: hypothetical protein E4H02_00735 [Lentisphaerales bacterium]